MDEYICMPIFNELDPMEDILEGFAVWLALLKAPRKRALLSTHVY